MLSCDFSDAIEIAPTSNGGSVTVDAPAAGESDYYADSPTAGGGNCKDGQYVEIFGGGDNDKMNIVETVASMPETFSTLVGLSQKADLVDTLSNQGVRGFTVFAPTNDTFAKIDAATLESLAQPENKDQLADILKYHVLEGRVFAVDLSVDFSVLGPFSIPSLEGADIEVTSMTPPTINDAEVTDADVLASNGVIHVIDTVLRIPPSGELTDSDGALGKAVGVAAGAAALVAALL